ncbi:MAG: COP9 signalosome catalytic subunit rri1 [Trizodia sp. TS-e1964]|nr:MAG: COP9 signalosome catalytic subunit rri1 [Trizodia sp. TS-e1964]
METALKSWELENLVQLIDSQKDAYYSYTPEEAKAIQNDTSWKKDPNHFTKVCISAVALLKMVMHARSGGSIEIMGFMQGKVVGDTFIITDAFRLPVEGTETRVMANEAANEYVVQYLQSSREAGQLENPIGWYHSHPGYGCWLSGIDVSTQMTQQAWQDPFLAVVIDPDRTISAGKVEIGAFRTYPEDYKPAVSSNDEYQTIPLAKIEDFGAHSSRYYALEISHFKSTLDTKLLELLWSKYWVSTLSQNPLFTNREYSSKKILDLSQKMKNVEKPSQLNSKGRGGSTLKEDLLEQVVKDANKITGEQVTGLLAGVIKESLFNGIAAPAITSNPKITADD